MINKHYPWLHKRCSEYLYIFGVEHLIKVDNFGNLLNKEEIIKEIDNKIGSKPDDVLIAIKLKLTGRDVFDVYYSKSKKTTF